MKEVVVFASIRNHFDLHWFWNNLHIKCMHPLQKKTYKYSSYINLEWICIKQIIGVRWRSLQKYNISIIQVHCISKLKKNKKASFFQRANHRYLTNNLHSMFSMIFYKCKSRLIGLQIFMSPFFFKIWLLHLFSS